MYHIQSKNLETYVKFNRVVKHIQTDIVNSYFSLIIWIIITVFEDLGKKNEPWSNDKLMQLFNLCVQESSCFFCINKGMSSCPAVNSFCLVGLLF